MKILTKVYDLNYQKKYSAKERDPSVCINYYSDFFLTFRDTVFTAIRFC
jgi:hypothetical protein